MFQKILIITALLCFLIITALFVFLIVNADRTLDQEMRQRNIFVSATVSSGIDIIRREVLYIFEQTAQKAHDLGNYDWDINRELLSSFFAEEHQLPGLPSILQKAVFVKYGNPRTITPLFGNDPSDTWYVDFLATGEEMLEAQGRSSIFIDDFQGTMTFPVKNDVDESEGYVLMALDLGPVIEGYLIPSLLNVLLNDQRSPDSRKHEFSIDYMKGYEIDEDDRLEESDQIIDLNRSFDLHRIKDYYFTRPESFLSVNDVDKFYDNHLYLVISHKDGSLKEYYKGEIIRSYAGLILLYLILIGSLFLFIYSLYRMRREYRREQQFTSLISHELKTPLSVIQLSAENLAGGYVSDKEGIIEYGEIIQNETKRLGKMIGNILRVSNISWTGTKEGRDRIMLRDFLVDVSDEFKITMDQFEVTMELNVADPAPSIVTDAALLKSALGNVMHNGIVYGAARSERKLIVLRCHEQKKNRKQGILISITDYGPGIGWVEGQKIFENYYRGSEITDLQLPGSGMGLALTKKILQGMGGNIQLKRSMRKETVFEIWLPKGKVIE